MLKEEFRMETLNNMIAEMLIKKLKITITEVIFNTSKYSFVIRSGQSVFSNLPGWSINFAHMSIFYDEKCYFESAVFNILAPG